MQSVVEVIQALIRIPSVNPDGDPGTDQVGELACARWVGDFLEKCGAEVSFEDVFPDRPNVIGHFPRNGDSDVPKILFAPHTDTVSIGGMTIDPFGADIRDGRVWGRGASDTKGTMAAMLWALWELRDEIPKLDAKIGFAGMMGEETGQPGSQHFVKNHRDEFDFAIVGEPTELDIVHAHKGCFWMEISTRGKAAHGSAPERGENAILKLNRVIDVLLEELSDAFADFEDEILGLPTVSLGMLQGGTRTNIVPDFAKAALDMRETPALREAGGALALLESILEKHGWEDEVEWKITVDSVPLYTDPELDEIKRLQKLGGKLTFAPWFCDAGWLARGGIPAVACGPGNIAQAHTKDEFIEIEKLEAGAMFYRKFLESYSS